MRNLRREQQCLENARAARDEAVAGIHRKLAAEHHRLAGRGAERTAVGGLSPRLRDSLRQEESDPARVMRH